MTKKSKLELPPLNLGDETPGERIVKLRKKQKLTQEKLGGKICIPQGLVSDYERNYNTPKKLDNTLRCIHV